MATRTAATTRANRLTRRAYADGAVPSARVTRRPKGYAINDTEQSHYPGLRRMHGDRVYYTASEPASARRAVNMYKAVKDPNAGHGLERPLSPRTVASHLYRSYLKLGIAGRHQLRDLTGPAPQ
jgi:hypothetical protein